MHTYMTIDQLSDIGSLAKSKREAGDILVIDPDIVLHLLEDLYWERLQKHEYRNYIEELQEVITDLKELADWEDDEWDAVKRLGNIRERLGMK